MRKVGAASFSRPNAEGQIQLEWHTLPARYITSPRSFHSFHESATHASRWPDRLRVHGQGPFQRVAAGTALFRFARRRADENDLRTQCPRPCKSSRDFRLGEK